METNGHARGNGHAPTNGRAFDDLYRTHYQGVVRFCRWRGRGVAPAEDLAQETFLRAYRFLHRLDPSRSPLPWLLTIARNVVNDRARSARPEIPVELLPEALDPTPHHPHDDHLTLASAMASLPRRDREALELRYVEGWDAPAAASRLGVSIDAFYQVLSRARRRLRNELRRLGETVPALVAVPVRWARERLHRAGARLSRSTWLSSVRPEHDAVLQVVGGFLVLFLAIGIQVGPGGADPARASAPFFPEASTAGADRRLGPAVESRRAVGTAAGVAGTTGGKGESTGGSSKGGGSESGSGDAGAGDPAQGVPSVSDVIEDAKGVAQEATKSRPKSSAHVQAPEIVEDVVEDVADAGGLTVPPCPIDGCEDAIPEVVSDLLP